MSNLLITQAVVALALVGSITVFLRYVAVPAIRARKTTSDRLAAGMLSLYAFGIFAGIGVALGIGIIWAWPQIA
ncbi:MAG: hypothetical protein WCI34_00870 [Actinomycetes bacterium]